MRIIDEKTGYAVRSVSSPEEAQIALSRDIGVRLEAGLRLIWGFEHPDDAARRDDSDDADDDWEPRTVGTLGEETAVLGAAVRPRDGHSDDRRRWSPWELGLEVFTERNALDWPVSISELRGEAALAEAALPEMAAHLNASLRDDFARVLRGGARYLRPQENFALRDDEPETAWEAFQDRSDLHELSLEEAAEAIAAGATAWESLDEWTPCGGVDGDPYGVCRYVWGPLRARVRLDAAELLGMYLAGDAELTLYRAVYDYGTGPTELIWPDQTKICCGFEVGLGDRAAPIRFHGWGRPTASLSAAGRCCRICGTAYIGRLLTSRRLDDNETATLGVTETLEGLPAATLAAIARDGVDVVAGDLPW